ncbi:glycosyltransferase family 2 protein [Marinilabiliaceae bacterium ANBcel2]|nr:glycosyltransferase family 2 protein [Marinilabiliaceae bacterium ANBcel2]
MQKEIVNNVPTIIAIVVTYNGSKWVDKCFGSLVNSSIPLKILAIDNASSDGTPELIRKKFSEVELIETGKNLGFGKANNIGLKRVLDENADYAFLLNQDAWVEVDTIQKLVEVQQKHPEFGILSPVPYDGEGRDYDYIYDKYYKHEIKYDNKYPCETYKIGFINAAGWLMSFELILNLGGFHNKFYLHGEDKNYIDRLNHHKKHLVGVCTSTKYYHDRKKRESSEELLSKRIYALESKIKTQMYNPSVNPVILLLKSLFYRCRCVLSKTDKTLHLKAIIFTLKHFSHSLFNRYIHIKL